MITALRSAVRRREGRRLAESTGAWCHREQQQLFREWSSSSSGERQGTSWVLVQRHNGTATTAAGSAAGGVQLERRYEDGSSGGGGSSGSEQPLGRFSLGRLRQAALSQIQATLLPAGFPGSVAPGYLRNVWFSAAHHCAGSANGVLASTFLLYSVGLGAGAVPTAGALNWVLKDGLGQLGTLLFGKTIAHNFDVSSRAWYLLASAKLNLAMGLEICTFLLPHYFLPIGALANAIKGLSWMAGGSTKSVFKVSFAADNNFGDVSAKATSQTICASILGTSAGVVLASQVGQSVGLAMVCYASLAACHLYTGYLAVRCVPLATLNPSRLELLIQLYLEQRQQEHQIKQQQEEQQQQHQQHGTQPLRPLAAGGIGREEQQAAAGQAAAGSTSQQAQQQEQAQQLVQQRWQLAGVMPGLPTPAQLAAEDPVFHRTRLRIGTSLHKLVQQHGSHLGELLRQQQQQRPEQQEGKQQEQQQGRQQEVGQQQQDVQQQPQQQEQQQQPGWARQQSSTPPPPRHLLVPAGDTMHLLFHEQADSADCILGFLHAYLLQHGSSSSSGGSSGGNSSGGSSGSSSGGSSSSRRDADRGTSRSSVCAHQQPGAAAAAADTGPAGAAGCRPSRQQHDGQQQQHEHHQHGQQQQQAKQQHDDRQQQQAKQQHDDPQQQQAKQQQADPQQQQQQQQQQEQRPCTPERLQQALEEARRLLPGLLLGLEASGWDDQKVVLEAKRRRLTW